MKKCIIALLLAVCMLSSAAAQEVKPSDVVTSDTIIALINDMVPAQFMHDAMKKGNLTNEGSAKEIGAATYVQTLNEGLLLLNAGRVDTMCSLYSTVKYIAARNPELVTIRAMYKLSMCMIAASDRQELIDTLNRGIEGMKADGTIDKLWETHVTSVIDSGEPAAVAMPEIADGLKLRVGVSGDVPPMDYVAADGSPAGFNTAMLAELAARENLAIELIQVDSGARFAALASGRIDAFFWQTRFGVDEENYAGSVAEFRLAEDETINCLTTVPYVSEYAGWLFSKSYLTKVMDAAKK